MLQALRQTSQIENTIIIFTSDNGGASYVGLPDINKPYRGWKCTLFEGGLRVPLFISWPKILKKNVIINQTVSHLDIVPTILSAVNDKLFTIDLANVHTVTKKKISSPPSQVIETIPLIMNDIEEEITSKILFEVEHVNSNLISFVQDFLGKKFNIFKGIVKKGFNNGNYNNHVKIKNENHYVNEKNIEKTKCYIEAHSQSDRCDNDTSSIIDNIITIANKFKSSNEQDNNNKVVSKEVVCSNTKQFDGFNLLPLQFKNLQSIHKIFDDRLLYWRSGIEYI